ncbi:MAG: replication endonuclease [Moritella sp.]|uniref:replication endonuclease n=1 Tax=Moritella sp. TaxID=78556 RepID=UPI0029BBD95D|nr:replication endonuclease [Moritella sp.]MDX2320499.1 replication endonuclease [Moritella sp.]
MKIQHGSIFARHHFPSLPVVVKNDVMKKIQARKKRGSASQRNIDLYADEVVSDGLKAAVLIEKEFPFVDSRNGIEKERIHGMEALNHFVLMQDEELKKLTQKLVNHNIKLIGSVEFDDHEDEDGDDGYAYMNSLFDAYALIRDKLSEYYLVAPMSDKKNLTTENLEVAIKKMICDDWILKQFLSLRRFYIEYTQIALGRVGNGKHQSKMISDISYGNWTESQRKAMAFIEATCLVNEDTGEQYDLKEVVKRTTSNPRNRHIEMMVKTRGFEELAVSKGYTALFFTWTLASKYHRNSSKWDGSSVKKGARRMMKLWGFVRAVLGKEDIDFFGTRVSEPHKDGTVHGHYFLFCHPDDKARIIEVMQHYATQEDREELGDDITPRFVVEENDPEKGGATAYIAKYIAKNVTGSFLPESDSELNAFKARAWSSTHRIKQFQSFGSVSVSLWRTVRRAKREDVVFNPDCLAMFDHADKSRWAKFCETAQEAKLVVEKSVNRYGETLRKVIGFSWLCKTILTTNGNFKLVSKSALASADKALKSSGATSWSTENNCNQSQPEATGNENNTKESRFVPLSKADFFDKYIRPKKKPATDEYAGSYLEGVVGKLRKAGDMIKQHCNCCGDESEFYSNVESASYICMPCSGVVFGYPQ